MRLKSKDNPTNVGYVLSVVVSVGAVSALSMDVPAIGILYTVVNGVFFWTMTERTKGGIETLIP